MKHFRDDKLIGAKLNKTLGRSNIDYTQWECWQTGSLIWGLHSYLEYLDCNLLNKLGVELAIANQPGQITKKMIKTIYREIFPRYDRLTALISPDNKQACRFARIAGFTLEGRLRKVDKGKDVYIFSIFKEEYTKKWEESLVGQNHHRYQPPQIQQGL